MTVRIVTDSTAYLRPGIADELNIVVVPFRITVDGETYLDGVDLDEDTFSRLVYEQGKESTAFSPTVEDFSRVYEELTQETSEILVILVSGTLSQACDHARQAAGTLLGRCQIEVVDSKTVSVGLGILVETAARVAAEGKSLDEIVRIVRGGVPQIYVVFFSDTLTYLENGGRIGHAQALLGTILGIKPFLTLEEGEIMPIEKVRTREQALEKLLEFVIEFDAIKQLAIVKGTSELDEETDLIIDRLHAVFPELDIPVLSYGPVLASHIGPDTMGIIVHESYDT
jgi:DegV family protein with EDD domain